MIVFSTIAGAAGALSHGALAVLPQASHGDWVLQGALQTAPQRRQPCRAAANESLALANSSPKAKTNVQVLELCMKSSNLEKQARL